MLEALKAKVKRVGKPQWRGLLMHVAALHEQAIHAPQVHLPYLWEEVTPEITSQTIFGHWDTVHIALDTMVSEPQHALYQVLNNIYLQEQSGLIPGSMTVMEDRLSWNAQMTFPPLWPVVIQDYIEKTGNVGILPKIWKILVKQIEWFETQRSTVQGGFYYLDLPDHFWESGVEEGARFDLGEELPENWSCVDATSHMFLLYDYAVRWASIVGEPATPWEAKRVILQDWIDKNLFSEDEEFYFDAWTVSEYPGRKVLTFEGFWPFIVGAASSEKVKVLIGRYLLDSKHFFTEHPVPSVSVSDPRFQNYHWRGPTRNSMTYWIARACMRYNHRYAARIILEKALDMTAKHFENTGNVWECYSPVGDDPQSIERPLNQGFGAPLQGHIGHNPVIAMANLWSRIDQTPSSGR